MTEEKFGYIPCECGCAPYVSSYTSPWTGHTTHFAKCSRCMAIAMGENTREVADKWNRGDVIHAIVDFGIEGPPGICGDQKP